MTIKPTTKKGVHTRATILDAARTVFARDGYVNARMIEIAEGAGLSTGGIYRYFKDKPDVFAALIEDLHEELFALSGDTSASFEKAPLAVLAGANRGYVRHYYENRDVMRAFVEAAAVDERFRQIWWDMRERHVNRFTASLQSVHGIESVGGVPARLAAEAMACMVEQCCYVWLAHEDMRDAQVSVEQASDMVTHAWYQTIFPAA